MREKLPAYWRKLLLLASESDLLLAAELDLLPASGTIASGREMPIGFMCAISGVILGRK